MQHLTIRPILKFGLLLFTVIVADLAQAAEPIRLYVLDCGSLIYNRPEDYGLKREEVASSNMAVTCYLIRHPKGTLLYDTGLSDSLAGQRLFSNLQDGYVKFVEHTLHGQLEGLGLKPADITYLALSHSDWDHVGNANDFASSVWLTPKAERDFMFGPKFPAEERRAFAKLENAKTVVYSGDRDVFGDGTVVLKATPGHTPGHQSLYVKLAHTGGVVLSGDLYHYPEERTLNRLPEEEKTRGTPEARAGMEKFLKESGSTLWIGHGVDFFLKARKSPEFYD